MGFSSGDPRAESPGDPRVAALDVHHPRLREPARSGGSSAELARATLAYLLSWRDGSREEALIWIGSGFSWDLLFKGRGLAVTGVNWSILALLGIDELHRATAWSETVIREAVAEGDPANVFTGLVDKVWGVRGDQPRQRPGRRHRGAHQRGPREPPLGERVARAGYRGPASSEERVRTPRPAEPIHQSLGGGSG